MSGSKRPYYSAIPSGFYQSTPTTTTTNSNAPTLNLPSASYYPYEFNNTTISNHNDKYESSQKKRQLESAATVAFGCDACDLHVFDSEASLQAHVGSHIKCTACAFAAAPKIVKAHYQAVHGKFSGSGYKTVTIAIPGCPLQRFRICVGNRPEDVQEWIAQRKKRFPRTQRPVPTSAVMQVKQVENEMAMTSLLVGYDSSSDSDAQGKVNANENTADDTMEDTVDTYHNKRSVELDSRNDIQKNTCKDDKPSESVAQHNSLQDRRRICRYFARNGTCRNGENCVFRHEKQERRQLKQKALSPSRSNQVEKTLLQKLLESDIQRETVITVQLLQYIVENQYFEETLKEEKNSAEDDDISF